MVQQNIFSAFLIKATPARIFIREGVKSIMPTFGKPCHLENILENFNFMIKMTRHSFYIFCILCSVTSDAFVF